MNGRKEEREWVGKKAWKEERNERKQEKGRKRWVGRKIWKEKRKEEISRKKNMKGK